MNKLELKLKDYQYPLYIENGLFSNLKNMVKEHYKGKKIVIVTDKNVDNIYGNIIVANLKDEFELEKIVIPPGEQSKSLASLTDLYTKLTQTKITRDGLIIAFGGGVVGDLTGFAAATFLRGIPFIQVPTTLLAQIDSSIGGKVAVDLPEGKNLVGTFYHPLAVIIDPLLLKTLEKRYLYDGMAEVIKTAAIKDAELFDYLVHQKNWETELDFEKVITNCCFIKKEVVEEDEKDSGERMKLNFGHTIGHGIEKIFQYKTYSHGEAVAVGMVEITSYAEKNKLTKIGTTEKLVNILRKYNLPVELPILNLPELVAALGNDKKNLRGKLNLVLLKEIGSAFLYPIEVEKLNELFEK